MARASVWLNKFAVDGEFVVTRGFLANGTQYKPGDRVPPGLFDKRRLQAMYQMRRIALADAVGTADAGEKQLASGGLVQRPDPMPRFGEVPLATTPAPPAPPQDAEPSDLEVKHMGRGKYAVVRGDERLTTEPLTKEEAELAKMVAAA